MISVLIPTLNNLEYLKCVVDSIRKHTKSQFEILVHANQVSLEMQQYLDEQKSCFSFVSTSSVNLGLPLSLNLLGQQVKGEFILYANDDMYFTSGWDEQLLVAINPDIHYQYLTAPMFEPQYANKCMNSPIDYGRTPSTFREQNFLSEWKEKRRITKDIVSPYCPIFVTKKLWDELGGYDEAYFPCFGTDPDFAAKIYFAAQKNKKPLEFRAVADVGVYHFQCITTDRLNPIYRQQAANTFQQKWGMTWGMFYERYLQIGNTL